MEPLRPPNDSLIIDLCLRQLGEALGGFAYRTTDLVRNNVGVVAADPQLTLPVVANAVYQVQAMLVVNGTSTADFLFGWNGPAGATFDWTPNSVNVGTATAVGSVNRSGGKTIADTQVHGCVATGTTNKTVALPFGLLFTASGVPAGVMPSDYPAIPAGNFALTWAQNVAEVSDTTLFARSWLRLQRLGGL